MKAEAKIQTRSTALGDDPQANSLASTAKVSSSPPLTTSGAVWVLQEFTKEVDPSLEADNLDQLGSKYKNLPEGWTFETLVLTANLSLNTGRAGGWAAIIRDEFGCTYQGSRLLGATPTYEGGCMLVRAVTRSTR